MKKHMVILVALVWIILSAASVYSAALPVPQNSDYFAMPPFINESAPPLVMFLMSKDQQLYFKAYTDVIDLDDDGIPDVTYKDTITYYGYFDPNTCYNYGSSIFSPSGAAGGANNHYCSGNWSGNFLNWATMSRIDVLRKVMYGGHRLVENNNDTVLGRSLTPNDAHAWVKVYTGNDLGQLTPGTNSAITICNADTSSNDPKGSKMTVYWGDKAKGPASASNMTGEFYPDAASVNGYQCAYQYNGGAALFGGTPYYVSVKVCDSSAPVLESYCMRYGNGAYRPSGLIQQFGHNRHGQDLDPSKWTDQMYFGLVTGSYDGNKSGGVLRSNITTVNSEVGSTDGKLNSASKLVKTLEAFQPIGWDFTNHTWTDCGLAATFTEGNCKNWGNPMSEMFYEAIRYFEGKGGPTSQFDKSDSGFSNLPSDNKLWCNPYDPASSCFHYSCSKPFILMMSDIYPSFDSDQLPSAYSNGTNWAASAISSSDTPSVQQLITDSNINQIELINQGITDVFIGQSGTTSDNTCSPKSADFSKLRGLCGEEPVKEGSYYMAGLARWAHMVGFDNNGQRNITTYAVATPTMTPKLEFNFPSAGKVHIIPSFADTSMVPSKGQISSFRILTTPDIACDTYDSDCATEKANGYQYGYEIMYDDSGQGNDYDLDIKYRIYVKTDTLGGSITVKTKGVYASAGHTDVAGYLINGVTGAGEYLEIGCGAGATYCRRYCNNNTKCNTAYTDDALTIPATYNMPPSSSGSMANSTIVRKFFVTGSTTGFLENPLFYAAKYGAYRELGGSSGPDLQQEWDEEGDGLPDTYFQASNPLKLEMELKKALFDILLRASAGSAVSVLATTGEDEGSIYQAFFFPDKREGAESRTWLGYLHGLLIDSYGNLREDTNGNDTLDMTIDKIIETKYDLSNGTRVYKYDDLDGDGVRDSSVPVEIVPLEEVKSIWNAGVQLWQTSPNTRKIYTTIDGTTRLDFQPANAPTLKPWLRAADNTEAGNMVKWTRGDDLRTPTVVTDTGHPYGYRRRTMTRLNPNTGAYETHEWKLGDIVYSTPTTASRPVENYDLLYGDGSYQKFRTHYLNTRNIVYVGANDGMLHAFNAGFYDEINLKFCKGGDSNGDRAIDSGECAAGTPDLGDELWAFIPRTLLPHLKWLTDPKYMHVYYVDLKPKVTEVPFFDCDAVHIGQNPVTGKCWGTILIGGLRYGGKKIDWTSGGANYTDIPEYYALDITDTENPPRLLWTFSDPDLGLAMSYPSLARVCDGTGNGSWKDAGCKWFAIFGSGTKGFSSNSDLAGLQPGRIFVLDVSGGANGVTSSWTLNTNYWKIPTGKMLSFLSDPGSVDVNMNDTVDVIYIGENFDDTGSRNAVMNRLTTGMGSQINPVSWQLSTLVDIDVVAGPLDTAKRITSPPNIALDDLANLWIYFGTGQFLGASDKNHTDTGAFYAIKDGCWDGTCTSPFTNLLDVSTAVVMTDQTVSGVSGSCSGIPAINTFTNLSYAIDRCYDGWAMYFSQVSELLDFTSAALSHAGERVVSEPVVVGGLAAFPSYIPGAGDLCSIEGDSNVYATFYKTGTGYKDYLFVEQKLKEAGNTSPVAVARVKVLGKGMPSTMAIQITKSGDAKGYAQSSTGAILEIETKTPFSLQGGTTGWKSEELQ